MLDKIFKPQEVEEKIYKMWEDGGLFTPSSDPKKKPFTIVLPLPNANDPMHMGHALFAVEDIMVRYHRMKGEPTLWLPGGDHAGIETQFVFEKHLAKEGKSRFDFDRDTLYKMIWDFAEKNKDLNKGQMKRLGFSLDWSRYHYSLEPKILEMVLETFRKLFKDDLVYRGERIVNYCTRCGTAFSELEVDYVERKDTLYYLKYGPFVLATTRPETKFGDTAVAFHPGDKRYEKYLGQEIEIPGVNGLFKVKVVADEDIDPDFGTGIEKVTPAHDAMDYEIGKRHGLPVKKVIGLDGRLTELAGRFSGMKINQARTAVYETMKEMGLIDHIDENYVHNVAVCYRCKTIIEPMVVPQWFVKIKPLVKPAVEAVKKGKTKIFPKKRFEKMYFDWMEKIHDWNISRSIVWGPRIPVWYCLDCNPEIQINFISSGEKINGTYSQLKEKHTVEEINKGLQSLIVSKDATYQLNNDGCDKCGSKDVLQETDTFDTWFLSGQWPVNTLKCNPGDFEYFYPTSVLDTMWDILNAWVSRMMMLGIYLTGEVPFAVTHMHARVVDKLGQKMSKSKGNVMDPIVMVDKYGADALRMALVIGVAPASDIAISEEKIKGQRNFANKVWNVARFILASTEGKEIKEFGPLMPTVSGSATPKEHFWCYAVFSEISDLAKDVTQDLNDYRFGQASEKLYEYFWHKFADVHLETSKALLESDQAPYVRDTLRHSLETLLKLLHPFMPFVTEAIWQQLPQKHHDPLIISKWPILDVELH